MDKKTVFEIIADHGSIVLTLVFAVLLICDKVNPMMRMIDNPQAKFLLAVLCLLAFINGVRLSVSLHKRRLESYRRSLEDKNEE